MTEWPSYWSRTWALTALLAAACLVGPAEGAAQDDLGAVCAAASAGPTECALAVSAVRLIQPRIGLLLWGGNPVPGTASTLGRKLPSTPRLAGAARLTVAPVTVPPLLDRSASRGSTVLAGAVSAQGSYGLTHGLSPVPTVGGFLSLDLFGRAGYALLPGGDFEPGAVWGVAGGVRVGVLRESFTLPGVSVTGTVGRSGTVAFGDPDGIASDGAMEGAVTGLGVAGVASKWIFGLRWAGGASYDRYASDVLLLYSPTPSGPQASARAHAETDRWSLFGSLTWTRLAYHTVLEAGWQEAPAPPILPSDVVLNPMGWWASLAFRVTP